MLTQLTVNNFAIVDTLIIDFYTGMTAITGETGAGKSIAIDALGLCLGNRADSSFIRNKTGRTDITAHFILNDTPSALAWLKLNQLDNNDNECLLRRVINQDGRSKAFINGTAVPISQLKELGQMLIQIHGQHEHQHLLQPHYQQQLLDKYIDENKLLTTMRHTYKNWKEAISQLKQYHQKRAEQEAHTQLLQYQLKELDEFMPIEGEYEQIDEEYKRLSNSEQLIQLSQNTLNLLSNDEQFNVTHSLNQAKNTLQTLLAIDTSLSEVYNMLDNATIQIQEAVNELRHYTENLEIDPEQIMQLEQRISKQVTLARKHHLSPEELPQFHKQLLNELEQIVEQDETALQLEEEIKKYHHQAIAIAEKLHQKRLTASKKLSEEITKTIKELSMPHGLFTIEIDYHDEILTESGADKISFMISTNPGQAVQPIDKVASGGELSRIALTIQVLTAKKMETPALIFDEVDVGISGPTAAKVGNLLRELGTSTQVITVTHLPQVAGNAHHHYMVSKQTDGKMTQTQIEVLNYEQRLNELARLLGGSQITTNTLANAQELLIQ